MNFSIESAANPRIKELVKLRESPKRRKEHGLFFVEGISELKSLVNSGREIKEIYYSFRAIEKDEQNKVLIEFQNLGIQTVEISPVAFGKASYRSAEYGWIGLVNTWDIGLDTINLSESGAVVVLDEVEKPGNLGAILRSVEALGGAGVILSEPALDFFNPNVVRSSRGLMGSLPIAKGTKQEVIQWLKTSKRPIWATSSHTTNFLGKQKMPDSPVLIFGSEKKGLGQFWHNQELGLDWVKIPMKGTASSLNLNASVACLLYEYNRFHED
jgi:TrmH family RNA methyltransferase